jgi:hypothetical protein
MSNRFLLWCSQGGSSKKKAEGPVKNQKCQYCGLLCVSLSGHSAFCMQFPSSCPNLCKEYKVVNLPRDQVIGHLRSRCVVAEDVCCPYVQFGCTHRAPTRAQLATHERSKAAHLHHIELLSRAFMDVLWSENAGPDGAAYVLQLYTAIVKQKLEDFVSTPIVVRLCQCLLNPYLCLSGNLFVY